MFKIEDWGEKCVKNHPDLAVEITRTEPQDEHVHLQLSYDFPEVKS